MFSGNTVCTTPQVLRPALQKDSNISFCSICCVLSFWNLGSWEGRNRWGDHLFCRSVGEGTFASMSGHISWPLPEEELPVPVVPPRSKQSPQKTHQLPVCKGMQQGETSAELNQTSDLPSYALLPSFLSPFQETKAASVYPHPHHTVRKPWASVSTSKAALAAALEMEPDNFGYEWLVCSSGWNSGWRGCSAGSPASELIPGQRAGKKGSLQCSALVVGPPLRDPVPVISGSLHRCPLKRCRLLPAVMVVLCCAY